MKPGNLFIQGAKSGGKTKDEDSIQHTSNLRCVHFYLAVGICPTAGSYLFVDV